MAFPTIQSYSKGGASDDVTSHSINLPNGVNVGDLLLVFFTCDNTTEISVNTTSSGNKWYNLGNYSSLATTTACYYKIAEASNVLTLTTNSIESSTYIVYRISGAAISAPAIQHNEGGDANADPPLVNALFGNKEYLWIVYAGFEGTVIPSSAPSGFTGLITEQSAYAEQPSSASAYDENQTGSAYDPGTFTSSSAYWVTFTVCIAPAGVDGIGLNNIAFYS
jgi:hypothetical protein